MIRGSVHWAIIAICMTAAGCGGGSDLDLKTVSGTLTWDGGDPVGEATITFMPEEGGPSSTAVTDASGAFTLRTGTGASGAVVGKHKVVVTRPKADSQINFNDPSSLQQAAAGRGGGDQKKGRQSPGGDTSASDASIPKQYTNQADTPLNYDVTADGSHGSVSFVIQKG